MYVTRSYVNVQNAGTISSRQVAYHEETFKCFKSSNIHSKFDRDYQGCDAVKTNSTYDACVFYLLIRGGAWNFPTGGLTLPTRGLKCGFQGIVNRIVNRILACSDRGAIAPSSPPLAPPLLLIFLDFPYTSLLSKELIIDFSTE